LHIFLHSFFLQPFELYKPFLSHESYRNRPYRNMKMGHTETSRIVS
jgi:hypothetical protein